jgi:hypothetical protein
VEGWFSSAAFAGVRVATDALAATTIAIMAVDGRIARMDLLLA